MSQNPSSPPAPAGQPALQPTPLTNRTVVVFGGTSGIGLAATIQAKAAGAKVIVIGFSGIAPSKYAARTASMAGGRGRDEEQDHR